MFLRTGIYDLSFSNACDHQRVNILSRRWSTFCLPERVGSKGLSRVKVCVPFAKGPWSSSANRSWKAAIKPGAAAKAGLALIRGLEDSFYLFRTGTQETNISLPSVAQKHKSATRTKIWPLSVTYWTFPSC